MLSATATVPIEDINSKLNISEMSLFILFSFQACAIDEYDIRMFHIHILAKAKHSLAQVIT
jgi:hypothetical protein